MGALDTPYPSGSLAPGHELRALVTGLYVLPSTVGYINHDCTRVASPAYSLFWRPSKGEASWWAGQGDGDGWSASRASSLPPGSMSSPP